MVASSYVILLIDVKQLVWLGAGYDSRPYRFMDQIRAAGVTKVCNYCFSISFNILFIDLQSLVFTVSLGTSILI